MTVAEEIWQILFKLVNTEYLSNINFLNKTKGYCFVVDFKYLFVSIIKKSLHS